MPKAYNIRHYKRDLKTLSQPRDLKVKLYFIQKYGKYYGCSILIAQKIMNAGFVVGQQVAGGPLRFSLSHFGWMDGCIDGGCLSTKKVNLCYNMY